MTTQRDVLLAAAERLFAERGIDAVSLRSVMGEAGTNVAAVSYHFGSKDELVAALIRTRSEELRAARESLLGELEDATAPTERQLAEALVRPVADLALRGEDGWIRFVDRLVTTRHPAYALLEETFAPQANRLGQVLRRIRPELPLRTVRFRMAEALSLTFRVLGELDFVRANVGQRGEPVAAEVVVAELLDAVTALLAGPRGPG